MSEKTCAHKYKKKCFQWRVKGLKQLISANAVYCILCSDVTMTNRQLLDFKEICNERKHDESIKK